MAHEVDLVAGVDAGKAVHTGRGRDVVGRVTDAVAIHIGGAVAVADTEGVHLADAVVHIVADAVAIGVGRAVATAHAEGVQLGAIAVTVSGWNVIAATVVDGPGAAADAAGIQLGTGAVVGVGIGVVVAGRRVRAARNGGRLHAEGRHVGIGEAPAGSHDLAVDGEAVAAIAESATHAVAERVVDRQGVAPVTELLGGGVARVVGVA